MYRQDLGNAPKSLRGKSDYESWTMVEAEQKDDLIIALMEELYGGDSFAMDGFRSLLSKRNIKWDSYSC